MIIIDIMWLTVVAYCGLQIGMMLESRGRARVSAALPLLIMLPVFFVSARGIAEDKHHWPFWLFVTAPWAIVYLVAIAAYGSESLSRSMISNHRRI